MDKIMNMIRNNVSLEELKDAEEKILPNPKAHLSRIQKFENIIEQVKKNKDLNLNNEMDKILEI